MPWLQLFFHFFQANKSQNNNNAAFDKSAAILLYQIATKLKAQCKPRLGFLVDNVISKKVANEPQLTGKKVMVF